MSIQIHAFQNGFGAELSGTDIRRHMDATTVAAISAALEEYAVLLLRDQPATDEEMAAFTSNFGQPQTTYSALVGKWKRRISRTDFSDISNLDENGKPLTPDDDRRMFNLFNQTWHTDTTFKPIPTKVAFLLARELPPKDGGTEWADMRRAYDDLSDAMKRRLEGVAAVHSQYYSRGLLGYTNFTEAEKARFPPVEHPLVRVQKSTGRKSLYLSSHLSHLAGLPEEEGRALVKELTAHATQRKYVYTHSWTIGDFIIWDNRTTIHRALPFEDRKYRRILARQGIDEDRRPIEEMREIAASH